MKPDLVDYAMTFLVGCLGLSMLSVALTGCLVLLRSHGLL